jgi:hypothetical protein
VSAWGILAASQRSFWRRVKHHPAQFEDAQATFVIMIDALPKTKGPEKLVPVVVGLKPVPAYFQRSQQKRVY